MDVFKDFIVIYLKKHLSPAIIIYDVLNKSKSYLKMPHEVGEILPGLNRVIIQFIQTCVLTFRTSTPIHLFTNSQTQLLLNTPMKLILGLNNQPK